MSEQIRQLKTTTNEKTKPKLKQQKQIKRNQNLTLAKQKAERN
jgi:hypothetical protein